MTQRTAPTPYDSAATLSLCVIVRDCERSLRQALESAKPFMDEMVDIDTG